jgi:iron complex outermembrane receptor protein
MSAFLLISWLAMTAPLPAAAQEVHTFNVPAADPASAIRAFGAQAGIQILASADDLKGKQLNPVNGEISTENGLNDLLAGTGLAHRYVGERAVALTNDDSASGSAGVTTNTPITGGRSVRLAQEGPTPTDTAHPGEHAREASVAASDSGNLVLSEIVVTAQKRSERLQDVPMSLTALSGDALESSKSTRLEDFVGKVPGLTLIDDGALGSQVVIRGITTGVLAINSSVATYIDETPYTVEGAAGGSYVMAPNLDTFDMQRIEVLRGPQGTLYGANALGGILKYVTNAPDPTGFQAKVESGVSSVDHGGVGFDTHGMVNLPLTEDAALRIVGYDNYYPGFIDDPARGLTDINGSRFVGTRASLLYTPVSNLSIRLNALYQDRSWNDFSNEDVTSGTLTPVYGSLGQEELNRQPGHVVSQLYNLTVNFDAGFANLLSTTSYYNYKPHALYDQSTLDHAVSGILGGSYGVAVQYTDPVQAVTQEIRLSSSGTQPLQWQVGGYFTNESTGEVENLYPVNAATYSVLYGYPVDLARVNLPSSYREYAGFANLDYFITPTFDVAAGGRYSENKQQLHEGEQGLLTGVIDINTPSSQGVFTYSGDVRWHLTPKTMLYARVAEGFVPGGPNDVIATAPVPKEYSSSTTMNYETGIKTSLLDGRFTAEVSAFLVDWRDIQLNALIGGIDTTTNGGTARSDGVEWDLAYKPIRELTLGFNGAYTDARLTEATPASVGGQVGNRLPAVPLWETSTDAEYERPLFGDYSGFMALDWRFMGARYADFVAAGERQKMPSYNIVDWRTGIGTKKWSVALYVKNVADKIAINYVRAEALPGVVGAQSAVVYTPRTVGLSLTANF